MNFKELGLCDSIVNALAKENITEATKVQENSIASIIEGKDVLLQSQTGSGKTFAYLLPLYEQNKEDLKTGVQTVILVPTRELAMQVHNEIIKFSQNSEIKLKSAVVFGNVNINTQIEKLKEKPQIVVGTADRILELIKKKKLPAHLVKTFIVDEADKFMDKSIEQLKAVRKTFMKYTQVIFVSATFSDKSIKAIQEIAPDINIIKEKEEIPANISHMFIVCEKRDKLETLKKLMGIMKPEKSLIFINKLEEIQLATEKLRYNNIDCQCIHGDISKMERQKILTDFISGKAKNLVATDLAARGLHAADISHIFSVDVAENPSDYLHRAGRSGRQGAVGTSITIATKNEIQYIKKYISRFGISVTEIKMFKGEIQEANK